MTVSDLNIASPASPPAADLSAALSIAWEELVHPSVFCAALVSALATWILARCAPRLGWVDVAHGAERKRKLQPCAAPVVGGAAVLAGLVAAYFVARGAGESGLGAHALYPVPGWATLSGTIGIDRVFTWLALLCAFTVGLTDDLRARGLSPRAKLVGQVIAGLLLVAPALALCLAGRADFPLWVPFAWVLGAVCVQNAINTFDNADGTATSISSLALVLAAPAAAAALLGFLPFNLAGRGRERRALGYARRLRARPYLGDSGSHLLGMLILIHPLAWPVIVLPLLDLARVSIVRLRLGRSPFRGDRRHLAHRLAGAGLSRASVVFVLLAIAMPSVLATLQAARGALVDRPRWILIGLIASAFLFAVTVRMTPDPDARRA